MKLQELEISKQLKRRGPVYWRDVVEKHGWSLVGRGLEAVVVKHPQKPYVLRVFSTDTPYVDFVKMVQAHQSNPHFPRFSRYVRPIPGTEMSYVRMEILDPVRNVLRTHLPELAYLYIQSTSMGLEFHDVFAPTVGAHLRELSRGSIFDKEIQKTLWEKIGTPSDSWKRAVDLLLELYQKGTRWQSELDMHPANFMLRGHTLVISDPLVGR